MTSSGQKRCLCGHLMAAFDKLAYCACCRDKGKGTDPCLKNEDCQHCNVLTEDQKSCLATPSYQKKKEKHDQKTSQKAIPESKDKGKSVKKHGSPGRLQNPVQTVSSR